MLYLGHGSSELLVPPSPQSLGTCKLAQVPIMVSINVILLCQHRDNIYISSTATSRTWFSRAGCSILHLVPVLQFAQDHLLLVPLRGQPKMAILSTTLMQSGAHRLKHTLRLSNSKSPSAWVPVGLA